MSLDNSPPNASQSSVSWHRHLPRGTDLSQFDLSASVPALADALADVLADGETLPAVWQTNWAADPQREVLHDSAHGWLSAGQLALSVQRCGERLEALGVSAGDRVLLSAPNCGELVIAHIALLSMGAVVVPINPGYQRNELMHIVQTAQPTLALLSDGIADTWREWMADRREWMADSEPPRGVPNDAPLVPVWADVVEVADVTEVKAADATAAASAPVLNQRAPNQQAPNQQAPNQQAPNQQALNQQVPSAQVSSPQDGALLIYTSGSTGTPKAALLSHSNLLASVRSIQIAWRWSAEDVLLLALPLSHMHGLGVGLYGTLTAGAKLVLHEAFESNAAFDAIKTHDVTMFFGVPTMYSRLLGSDRLGEFAGRTSKLRLCVSGSAALPAQAHRQFQEKTGMSVLERYGMTETAMLVSNPYDGERRPGTIGFPLPGVQLRLAEDTNEIQVRGPSVFAGYWTATAGAGASTDKTAFVDGWFCTGDVGEISDDGYVSIVGRLKEIVISGGYNVHPREVEEAILQHPGVAECAITGEPDEKWGEVVAAFIVPQPDYSPAVDSPAIDLAELRNFLSDRLANYKRPQRCYLVAELPRNALGKVQRHLLARP